MELGASVKDATIVLVLEPFKRHGRPLEVLQKGLELLALACGDAAVGVDSKPGVFPALEQRAPFLGDLLLLKEHFEELLAKDPLHRREVEILRRRVEHPIAGEDAERREGMRVGVEVGEVSEGLRSDDHRRDGDDHRAGSTTQSPTGVNSTRRK